VGIDEGGLQRRLTKRLCHDAKLLGYRARNSAMAPSNALLSLAAASAGIAVRLAMIFGHHWRDPVLSNWDEAFAFATVALLASFGGASRPARALQKCQANTRRANARSR
jgi:hypothetical protein